MKKWIALILIGLLLFAAGCSSEKNTLDWEAIEAAAQEGEGEEETAEEPEEGMENAVTVETVAASPDEPVAAANSIEGGWGYINTSGQWVIAPQYAQAYPFVDNVATVQLYTNEWQLIDKSGAVIAQFPSDIEVFEPLRPTVYPECGLDSSGCTIFDGMIIIVKDGDNDGFFSNTGVDLFGYADVAGNIVVEPQYLDVGAFGDGLAPVDVGRSETNGSGKTVMLSHEGYIDKTGKMVIEPQFSYAAAFSDGMAIIQTDEDYPSNGYIDTTGTLQLTTDHYQYPFGDFKDGIAPILTRDGAAVVDKTGAVLGEVAGAEMQPLENSISASINSGVGFSDGLFPLFDVSMEYDADTGFYPVGFINTKGEFAIPAQTEWKVCQGFSNGLCLVYQGEGGFSLNNKYGYIDTTGALVMPLTYSSATMFQFDRAIVAVGEIGAQQWSIIDTSGKTVVDLGDTLINALSFTK